MELQGINIKPVDYKDGRKMFSTQVNKQYVGTICKLSLQQINLLQDILSCDPTDGLIWPISDPISDPKENNIVGIGTR